MTSKATTRQDSLIQDTVNSLLTNIPFKELVHTMVKDMMSEEIYKLQKRVEESEGRVMQLECQLKNKENEICSLHADLEKEKTSIQNHDLKYNEIEQYSRRNNLRIFGIAEKKGENTDQLVIDVAKRIGVKISLDDIDRSHRTGKPHAREDPPAPTDESRKSEEATQDAVRPRPILVKFTSYRRRHDMITQRRKLKKTKISISEDLSKFKLDLLRETAKHPSVRQAWTTDGRIIALLGASNGKNITKLISTFQDLKNLPTTAVK